jgi:flagellar basal-body rod protein FlgB
MLRLRPGGGPAVASLVHRIWPMLDPVTSHMEQYLDLLSARQQLVASNVANLDTPGYRTRDIDFQLEFESQIAGGSPNVIEPTGLTIKNDDNNVSLDRETRLLAENAMRFNFASNLLKNELRTLKSAIDGGQNA